MSVFSREPVDENLLQVTQYEVLGKLPNPFVFEDGTPLTDPAQWPARREEIYKTAVELQYGVMPPEPEFVEVEWLSSCEEIPCMDCYIIHTGTRAKPIRFSMIVFRPRGEGPFPTVVDGDLSFRYPYEHEFVRGFTENGIALALFNRVELVPDLEERARLGQMYQTYPDGKFGAIAAWAWGYSRCVDALERIGIADMSCITFTGHSRGAKTAVLAGAVDQRAAIVNPNATCAGGCGCYRIHMTAIDETGREWSSETLKQIVGFFPFWFTPELAEYADREEELPFDSHYLKALIAPRVFLDSQAGSDLWANPIGSWQTSMAAKEVYKFLGVEDNLYWHFRRGYHYHDKQDVEALVNVILRVKRGVPLSDTFFRTPFKQPELIFDWRAPNTK